jgi:hypothetical protein
VRKEMTSDDGQNIAGGGEVRASVVEASRYLYRSLPQQQINTFSLGRKEMIEYERLNTHTTNTTE